MRFFRNLIAGVLLASLVFVPMVAPAPALATDATGILGPTPTFSSGFYTDANGTWYKQVTDSTASSPAAVGKLLYFTGSTWIQAATANVPLPIGMYGVVVTPASVVGGTATIAVRGLVTASVKTGGTYACAATGDVPLAITTTGDLTPTGAATVPGVTWGFCASVLAVSQAATLISVVIGGY